MSLMPLRTVNLLINGEPGALVSVTETADGKLNFKVKVTDVIANTNDLPDIADLRGLFFHVSDENLLPGLSVSGEHVTDYAFSANSVIQLKGGANLSGEVGKAFGPFDIGIEFGRQGIGHGDDIRESSFTLAASVPLRLEFVLQQHFGLRLMSVSDNGQGRELSLKLAGQMTGTPTVVTPPSETPSDPGDQTDPDEPSNPPSTPDTSYDDLIEGGDGNDTIYGGLGNDEMQGEGGDDVIVGGKDNGLLGWEGGLSVAIGDNLYGNDGNDTFLYKKGDGVDLIWDFQPGKDIIKLTGYTLSDVSAFTFVSTVSNRIETGSHDKIAVILDEGGEAIVFNDYPHPSDSDIAIRFADGTTLSSGQILELARAGSVAGGSAAHDAAPAGSRSLATSTPALSLDLYGGNGDDTLIGGLGNDRLYGNEGINALNGRTGNDELYGGNVRDILLGEEGDDIGYGNGGDDLIIGGTGSDKLYGAGGADVIYGDDGEGVELPALLTSYTPVQAGEEMNASVRITNTWWGGFQGEITVTANESVGEWDIFLQSRFNLDSVWGARTVAEASWSDGITYNLANASWNGSLSIGQQTTIGFTATTGVSGVVDASHLMAGLSIVKRISTDPLPGESIARTLGNTLRGYAGADTLVGTGGNDTFYIDDAADTVIETYSGGAADTVIASVSHALDRNVENVLAASGTTRLALKGNTLKNKVTGNSGANTIDGGYGNDKLYGGAGKDSFVFKDKLGTYKTDRKKNFDTISDFKVKDDSLRLDNKIFKKLGKGSESKPMKLNKKFFTIDTKAEDKNDYLIYNKKTGILLYDKDGSGSGKAIEFAKLSKNLKLKYNDFYVI